MSDEKQERWLNYLAITTVVFAVFATLSSFNGGKHSTRAILCQEKATDTWSQYQSKSVKGYLYEMQRDKLSMELEEKGGDLDPKLQAGYRKTIARYTDAIGRYEKEKKEIMEKARSCEKNRDDAQVHSRHFGYAIIFLQIAILLSGVAGFVKNKPVWWLSIVTGIAGIVLFFEAFSPLIENLLQKYHLFI